MWANVGMAKWFGLIRSTMANCEMFLGREMTRSKQYFEKLLSAHDGKTLPTIIISSYKIKKCTDDKKKEKRIYSVRSF